MAQGIHSPNLDQSWRSEDKCDAADHMLASQLSRRTAVYHDTLKRVNRERLVMSIPPYILVGLLAASLLPWASNLLSDRIDQRRKEMLLILLEIERLYKNGEEHRHLPARRSDYLRWEAYLFIVLAALLILLSVAGIVASIDIFQSQWWQRINNPNALKDTTITNARTLARGFLFIQLLKIWPFFIILMSFVSAWSQLQNITLVLPAAKRYVLADLRRSSSSGV